MQFYRKGLADNYQGAVCHSVNDTDTFKGVIAAYFASFCCIFLFLVLILKNSETSIIAQSKKKKITHKNTSHCKEFKIKL